MFRFLCICVLTVFAAACGRGETNTTPAYHADTNPALLSEWGMVRVGNRELTLNERVIPYDLATPLFTDYALKLRTVWMPDGGAAQYNSDDAFDFPVGTVITKTFYYPTVGDAWTGDVTMGSPRTINSNAMSLDHIRLVETRVLVHREEGWEALPYIWNDEQTDAVLKRIGDVMPMTLHRNDGRQQAFNYVVPNANQCAGCHATNATTKAILPIGPKARHLNKASSFAPGFNQLDHWIAKGMLTGGVEQPAPRNAIWTDESEPLAARAKSYLDANCSHCHNPSGPADTSGLFLEPETDGPPLGICKMPIAAGTGTGGRAYDIVPGRPDLSITVFRMETTDPASMMPELGRSLSHEEGVALISQWIEEMDGNCATEG